MVKLSLNFRSKDVINNLPDDLVEKPFIVRAFAYFEPEKVTICAFIKSYYPE